ncbi:COG1089: GDP-D-mannose dehydratase [Richelia intracellularis HH01]|jgi:hypothetical protein|uniref:COG1089: GDP-D-mannose dehydratase n=1 Tax=Richelia intracellularis HH01 TaxID=1165094 RepID=M1WZS1_9NOST|nr:hypothetical protein [Richelia intracellularis]CCH67837.1 COG1089: GDP-D-mannose dehydratase [Richelia intracellularis HH01]HAE05443.1 hypothetical protein [Richelia sp.]
MILAQFRSLYPTGALITELLQISHGQYIVRATVKIEDVIRSTGMASALNIEEAEDKSRERALMVLGITNTSSLIEDTSLKEITSTLIKASSEENSTIIKEVNPEYSNKVINQTKSEIPDNVSQTVEPLVTLPLEIIREATSDQAKENEPALEERSLNIAYSNSSSQNGNEKSREIKTIKKSKEYEPINQSDDIAKISAEMQRLGWTMEQGRDYLIKTYDKRSRHLLSQEELKNFLEYLESQTTLIEIPDEIDDPLSGF